MIRVLQIVPDLGVGGLPRVVETLCRALDPVRFEPIVLCQRYVGELGERLRETGVHVLSIGGATKRPDYFACVKVARVIRSLEIDVIHTHNTGAMFDGVLAGLLAGVKTMVHTDHGRHFPDKWRYMAAERFLSRFLHRFVAVSDDLRDDLRHYERIPGSKLLTIPNGIIAGDFRVAIDSQTSRQELRLPREGPVIGLGARLVWEKGLEFLVRALPAVRKRYPHAVLLIAGDGPEREALMALAHNLNVDEGVRLIGLRHDMPQILQLLDVYVMASVSEGLPMGLLEALAAGRPIVATNVGGIPNAVAEGVNGRRVPPRDPEALATAILDVLDDQATRVRYGAESRRIFEDRFSADAMAKRYATLYMRTDGAEGDCASRGDATERAKSRQRTLV